MIFVEVPEATSVDTPEDAAFVCAALGENTYTLNGKEQIFIPQEFKGKTAMYQIISLQYYAWKNLDLDYYGF